MRILKQIDKENELATLASKLFDKLVVKPAVPLNFDYLEFNLVGHTSAEENKIRIGIDIDDPILADKDRRTIRILITFEMFRIFVRRMLEKDIPVDVEDVIIAREMIKRGYIDDIAYLFYIYAAKSEVFDIKSSLKFHLIAKTFVSYDEFYTKFFNDIANKKSKHEMDLTVRLFLQVIERDLLDDKNLNKAIELYEAIISAGD